MLWPPAAGFSFCKTRRSPSTELEPVGICLEISPHTWVSSSVGSFQQKVVPLVLVFNRAEEPPPVVSRGVQTPGSLGTKPWDLEKCTGKTAAKKRVKVHPGGGPNPGGKPVTNTGKPTTEGTRGVDTGTGIQWPDHTDHKIERERER